MSNKLKSKKNIVLTVLRVVIALVAVGFVCFICFKSRRDLYALFSKMHWYIFGTALMLFILANVVISTRWYTLLRAQNIKIPYFAAVKVHFLGLFYNNIMVSSVGGDVLRMWYITRHTHKRLEAAISVLVDRVIGLTSLILMAVSFYCFFPVNIQSASPAKTAQSTDTGKIFSILQDHKQLLVIVAASIVVFVVLLVILPVTRRYLLKISAIIVSHSPRVITAMRIYGSKPITILFCVGLTFIAQSLAILGLYLIGRTMGIPAPMKFYFVFLPIGWVISALPISIGGVGILELGLVGMFMSLPGVDESQGTALALCWRFIFIFGAFPGIVIHLLGSHLPTENPEHMPADKNEFFIDSEENLQ